MLDYIMLYYLVLQYIARPWRGPPRGPRGGAARDRGPVQPSIV